MNNPKFYKTKEFQELNDKWQKKLKKAGFEDIEKDEFTLKSWSLKFVSKRSINSYKAKETYYRMATQFLNDYTFESPGERAIWAYHSEGMSFRQIAKIASKLKLKIDYKISKDSIGAMINRFQVIMHDMYRKLEEEYDREF